MTEVKPCPFCGGQMFLSEDHVGHYCGCHACGMESACVYPTRDAAIAAANRRADDPAAEKMAQALVRARDALERAADDLGWVDDTEMTLEEFVKPALGSIGVALGQWEERRMNNG